MITVAEYAHKVEVFIDLWRENLISDFEFVESVENLSKDVIVVRGNYVVTLNSQVQPRPPQDGLQGTGHIDAGPYWQG